LNVSILSNGSALRHPICRTSEAKVSSLICISKSITFLCRELRASATTLRPCRAMFQTADLIESATARTHEVFRSGRGSWRGA
jgi:hypothetical protein